LSRPKAAHLVVRAGVVEEDALEPGADGGGGGDDGGSDGDAGTGDGSAFANDSSMARST
jgi:hypothetical protein